MQRGIPWKTAAVVVAVLLATGCEPSEDFENEGSPGSPVVLTVGVTHSGTIDSFGTSYYRFNTTVAGSYTIALTGLDSDLSWDICDDAGYSSYVSGCDDHFDSSDEIDIVGLSDATPYYLMVDEWDGTDGEFRLLVSPP